MAEEREVRSRASVASSVLGQLLPSGGIAAVTFDSFASYQTWSTWSAVINLTAHISRSGRAAASTGYGGPVARRRRADDGEAEQTRRARRGREQDVAEISRRMYEEIRSSRNPRDHVEDG